GREEGRPHAARVHAPPRRVRGRARRLRVAREDGRRRGRDEGRRRPLDEERRGVAVDVDGTPRAGFPTPSKKLELFSPTMAEWGFADQALPNYIESHLHESKIDRAAGEMGLLPTFRLPTLIHTRSGNSKWLNELSNANPVWIHTSDAARLGV